jgi:hypothetical protein
MSQPHKSRVLAILMLITLLIVSHFSSGSAAAANGTISINDVTVTEGNTGTLNATFTISLSVADPLPTTVAYATADNTAITPGDYTTTAGIATIAANATSTTVTVKVVGDTLNEANETFFVNLTDPTNTATILDG